MMASKLLKAEHGSGRFVRILDRVFGSLRRRYEGRLHRTLDRRPVTIMVLVGRHGGDGHHVHDLAEASWRRRRTRASCSTS